MKHSRGGLVERQHPWGEQHGGGLYLARVMHGNERRTGGQERFTWVESHGYRSRVRAKLRTYEPDHRGHGPHGIPLYKPGLTTAAIPRPGDGVTVYKPYVFDKLPPGAGAKSVAHSRRMHAILAAWVAHPAPSSHLAGHACSDSCGCCAGRRSGHGSMR